RAMGQFCLRRCAGFRFFVGEARRDEPGREGTLQHAGQIKLCNSDCNQNRAVIWGFGQLVTTPASQGAWWQAPARRAPTPGGSGRLSRSAPCLLRPCCSCYLILQREGADCGIASPVITALCGQNSNRQSEHERGGGDDYAFESRIGRIRRKSPCCGARTQVG